MLYRHWISETKRIMERKNNNIHSFFFVLLQICITEKALNESRTSSDQKPSEEFLKAIFGDSEESSIETEDEEDSQKAVTVPSTSQHFLGSKIEGDKKSFTPTKMITVMDMDLSPDKDDDKEFGPVPPPLTSLLKIDLKTNIVVSNKKSKLHFTNVNSKIVSFRNHQKKMRKSYRLSIICTNLVFY